ncbi:hypothetical protein K7I13_11060 [Brucepastera parasyntrophica]|uniref:toxin TcdB middle/N-terminal domain-containing protein n=1 Tax=Brucepastera parasyntrophica TaxID=2880008 RepID=UPI00210C7983|nr:toxin TcdB middle/N-terminal domain-containing protein [Brucepastera parasyntrophica]ULQ59047.1 hypothetical protein K7I13_11060 [Brucepastera parasyntrophica]
MGVRLRANEGSLFNNGNYIALGQFDEQYLHAEKDAENQELLFYVNGISTENAIKMIPADNDYTEVSIQVTFQTGGKTEAEVTWEFTDPVESAETIEESEMNVLWRDEEFDQLFVSPYLSSREHYDINNQFWDTIAVTEMEELFAHYITGELVTNELAAAFYENYFAVEKKYVIKSTLSNEQKNNANAFLELINNMGPNYPCDINDAYWEEIVEAETDALFSHYINDDQIEVDESDVERFLQDNFEFEEEKYKRKNLAAQEISEANIFLQQLKVSGSNFPNDIGNPFWKEITVTDTVTLFDYYINEGLAETAIDDFFESYFEIKEENYKRNVLTGEESNTANEFLSNVEWEYFHKIAFPCYEYSEDEKVYNLVPYYASEDDNSDAQKIQLIGIIQSITKKYLLHKYQQVKKTIRYDANYIYAVEDDARKEDEYGRFRYIGLSLKEESEEVSLEKKISSLSLTWDSAEDYAAENRSKQQVFKYESSGYDSSILIPSIFVPSDDILYGGINNWFYGIWIGDEAQNKFSEERLYENVRKAEQIAEDVTEQKLQDKPEEQESYMKEKANVSGSSDVSYLEEQKKAGSDGKVDAGQVNQDDYDFQYNEEGKDDSIQIEHIFYLPSTLNEMAGTFEDKDSGKVYDNKQYLDLKAEAETSHDLSENYLMGEMSISSIQTMDWDGGERQIKTEATYYFPFIDGDYIHVNRQGGDIYYKLPGIKPPQSFSGIGTLRKNRSAGDEIGGAGNVTVVQLNSSINTSHGETIQDIRDINGDRIPDIIYSNGAKLSVLYGSRVAGEYIQYGDRYDLYGSNSVLSRTDNRVETSGIGASAGPTAETIRDIVTNRVIGMTIPASASASFGMGHGEGSNEQSIGMLDINGDGIDDYINGETVKLGTGYAYSVYDFRAPDNFSIHKGSLLADSKSIGVGAGTNASGMTTGDNTTIVSVGIGAGVNASISRSRTKEMLLDINGDGLPDIVKKGNGNTLSVQYNMGTGFTAAEEIYMPGWGFGSIELNADETRPDQGALNDIPVIGLFFENPGINGVSSSDSNEDLVNEIDYSATINFGINGGLNTGGTVSIKVWFISINMSINANAGVNGGVGTTSVTVKMLDIDGDGYVDQVLRIPGKETYVKRNLGAQIGLLKKIILPQGGSYELEYMSIGNTTDMPQSRQVLSQVTLRDDLEDSIINSGWEYIRRFEYKDGYYDRLVREFYGFRTVTARYGTEEYHDKSRTEVQYYNDEYYRKGIKEELRVYDENGVLIQSQEQIPDVAPYARIKESYSRVYDEDGTYFESAQRYEYDVLWGNVTVLYDDGDIKDTSDNLEARISYWHNDSKYLHSHPSRIEIRDSGGKIVRVREGDYNEYGSLVKLRQYWNEGKYLTHEFTYDGYGNMSSMTNSAGVSLSYRYDSGLNQYLEEITRTGGGASYVSRIAWNTSRGLKERETDSNGNSIRYEYDEKGRLTEVRTSYDTGTVPAVSYEYHTPEESRWYAVTSNKITTDSSDSRVMLTVTELDGIGRVRRTAKAGEVYNPGTGNDLFGWNVSGAVQYDGRGRVVRGGQPYFVGEDSIGTCSIQNLLFLISFWQRRLHTTGLTDR